MTIRTKVENKANFETGDVPTGTTFSDLIDSYEDVGVAATLDTNHLNAVDPHGDRSYTDAKVLAANPGGATVSDGVLKAWTESCAYEAYNITYSGVYIKTAYVKWPDLSSGVLTVTSVNTTYTKETGYNITHNLSNKTITQTTVTLDSNGNITTKPVLTVV